MAYCITYHLLYSVPIHIRRRRIHNVVSGQYFPVKRVQTSMVPKCMIWAVEVKAYRGVCVCMGKRQLVAFFVQNILGVLHPRNVFIVAQNTSDATEF